MIDRRQFVGTAMIGALAAPLASAVRAQQSARKPVVAFVFSASPVADMLGPDPALPIFRAFVHGLRDLGWVEGRNVVIERRSAEGYPERAQSIFADLVARGIDVIALGAADWLRQAAQQATSAIPLVALFPEDPVAAGLVASLARPGGNLTGVTMITGQEIIGKRLQLLREMAPRAARIAFLGPRRGIEAYRADVKSDPAIEVFARFDRPEEYPEAFAMVLRERADALLVLGGPIIFVNVARIATFAAENRLPAIYSIREAVEAGGLMSYGASTAGLFRQMSGLVDRILKGARPAELPIEQPREYELAINVKTAQALGLTVPPALLGVADLVIE